MNEWDSAVGRLLAKFTELMVNEQPQASGGLSVGHVVQPDLTATADLLARFITTRTRFQSRTSQYHLRVKMKSDRLRVT